MQTLRIVNAEIINEGSRLSGDLLIQNGRIERIDTQIEGQATETVIDAKGKALIPGMIDVHVHFREPGLTQKGDLHSESRAALAGGITSIMEMPNTKPAAVNLSTLEEKYALASTRALTNYSFYLGASNHNIDELLAMDPTQICGVKLFMGASTGNLLVDRKEQLEAIFSRVKVPVALHCEDTATVRANEQAAREKYGEAIPFTEHGRIRSEEACYLSTQLAVDLATRHGTQIHVLHLTTERELSFFKTGPVDQKKITVEACPHHLWFSEEDYETKGSLIKCNPSIKTAQDRDALRAALLADQIDTVGTDHAPHLWDEKQNPYDQAPSGMPVVQSAIPSLLEFLPIEKVVEKCAHNPARIYQVKERGFIREGYFADLTLVGLDTPHTVGAENILYKCGWSPFEGATFSSTICTTIVNGVVMYHEGQFQEQSKGMRLEFTR